MVLLCAYHHLKDTLVVYERELKDKILTSIRLTDILAIEPQVLVHHHSES